MSDRITDGMLRHLCDRINKALGTPLTPYKEDADGKAVYENNSLVANEGNVHLAGAYGGTRLEQMSFGGGARNVIDMPLGTKRQTWQLGQAYLAGIIAGKAAK